MFQSFRFYASRYSVVLCFDICVDIRVKLGKLELVMSTKADNTLYCAWSHPEQPTLIIPWKLTDALRRENGCICR